MSDTPNAYVKRIVVKCYDKELYRTKGNGTVCKSFKADDPDVDQKIAEFKQSIKDKNAAFAAKVAAGEVKLVRRVPKNQPIVEIVTNGTPDPLPMVVDPALSLEQQNAELEKRVKAQQSFYRRIPTIVDRTKFELKLDPYTGNTTFLLGSSKSGKSTALMKLYDKYYGKDPNFISILWTGNPQIKMYRGHKRLLIAGVEGHLSKENEQVIRTEKELQRRTKSHYKFLNMFDDVISVRNNELLDNLILTYRNSLMSSIISLQYSNLLSKCARANMNNVLAFSFNTDEAIEVMIRTFLTGYCSKIGLTNMPDKINWYKSMTRDHGFIYIKPADDHVSFHKFTL
jgi:hypothetical protein